MMRILVINGPNLDLLGKREPEVYGRTTLTELEDIIAGWGEGLGCMVETVQANDETRLIEWIHQSDHDGIVLNPGALTHTSRALADAIEGVMTPVVEVHISNIKKREPWRAESMISAVCVRSIYGRGITGYRDALRHQVNRAAVHFQTIRYGPHSENVGDLRRAGSELVVLVHGGFWKQEWERDTMESLAIDLHARGLSSWNLEYRRFGTDGEWPASGHDVLMALDFIPQLQLTTTAVSVIGHSAGAYLGMWAATRTQTGIKRNISLGGVLNLESHGQSGLIGSAEAQLLLDAGAPPGADPGEIPITLVHGRGDSQVPYKYASDLGSAHGVEVIDAADRHFSLLDPSQLHWQHVVGAIQP